MQHIADRIRAEMQSAGLSESALADAASIPRVTLRRRLARPGGLTLAEIERLAAALDLTTTELTFKAAS